MKGFEKKNFFARNEVAFMMKKTVCVPLEAELLPNMDKTAIPFGTLLTPYQTDGKSYVDLKTENGGIVRRSIDVSNWPRTVNGIPEDECFEELLYAG